MAKRTAEPALPRIFTARKQKVVLDADLAKLYGVPTKQLNQAVLRNSDRFPSDFCFFLTEAEVANLKSQFVTSSPEQEQILRSQTATSSTSEKKALEVTKCDHKRRTARGTTDAPPRLH